MALTRDLQRLARLYADTSCYITVVPPDPSTYHRDYHKLEEICPACKLRCRITDTASLPRAIAECDHCHALFVLVRSPETCNCVDDDEPGYVPILTPPLDRVRLAWVKRIAPSPMGWYVARAPVSEKTVRAFAERMEFTFERDCFALDHGWTLSRNTFNREKDPDLFNISHVVNSFNVRKPKRPYPHDANAQYGFLLCNDGRKDFAVFHYEDY